jgi:replicative DNA helicase
VEQSKGHRSAHIATVAESLEQLDRGLRSHSTREVRTIPTQFPVLDDVLGGGLHGGELLMLGGPPGVGKTIMALQWARNMAKAGHLVIYACYEHEPITLLTRLLALESGEAGGNEGTAHDIERALSLADTTGTGLEDALDGTEGGSEALKRLREYQHKLIILRASGTHTTVDDLRDLVTPHVQASESAVLFIDYLQKIPLHPEPETESEKVTRTVEMTKDLALDLHIPTVMLSAVDSEGMRANRIRLYHLRGSSAIAFESDVVLMMNDKQRAISKIHLSYDPVGAREFKHWVVTSVEKNRGGPNLIDLQFRKDFGSFRFNPQGGVVTEKLVDERLDEANF